MLELKDLGNGIYLVSATICLTEGEVAWLRELSANRGEPGEVTIQEIVRAAIWSGEPRK